ncbi:MAG TPA: HoxN/HupN/NixA family nickel/cobalt transporter [Candidatus Nitrosotalea sp.]|nr:HoxN/HupN/NixA family nickel/cobalt transporter [Candidatus Nitrosotalea sp.]
MLGRLWTRFDGGERRRLGGFMALVALLHVAGFGLLLYYGLDHPAFLGLGGLAYTFGLRHAFDADHIAAIDNSTRKLLHEGRRPIGVGFFFSIGHSTVVLLIALGLGFAARYVVQNLVTSSGQLHAIGGLLGTGISGAFLILIGILNLFVLLDIARVYRRMRQGGYDRDSLRQELVAGGLMTRLFGRLFALVRHSWDMYPIGFLFGLGFDTASEVALLAISAGVAARGLPLVAVLALPLIFAAGMSLMDTADGAFMAKAYAWAFSNPVRKVFYNLTVTGLSVFVALLVGGVEVGQILIQVTGVRGPGVSFISRLDLGSLGFVIVGAFILTWAVALAIFKLRRVEERWGKLVAGE